MLCCAGYPSSSLMDTTMPVAAVGNTPDDGAVSQLTYLSSLCNTGKYILPSYVINCYSLLISYLSAVHLPLTSAWPHLTTPECLTLFTTFSSHRCDGKLTNYRCQVDYDSRQRQSIRLHRTVFGRRMFTSDVQIPEF